MKGRYDILLSNKQQPTPPPQQNEELPSYPQNFPPTVEPKATSEPAQNIQNMNKPSEKNEIARTTDTTIPSNHDTMTPRNHDTTKPPYTDTMIALIRKEVRRIGKEQATHRFTVEEKQMVRRIVRDFEDRGLRTVENEITRIGIHFLFDDYQRNGENSLLFQALKALHE